MALGRSVLHGEYNPCTSLAPRQDRFKNGPGLSQDFRSD